MEILKKLNQNNFNEVAKLIENNQLPEQLMSGSLKSQLQRYRLSYSTPASLNLAQKHKKAAKYGYRPASKYREDEVCGCCNLRVQNQGIRLCQNVQIDHKKKNQFINELNNYKLTSDVALFLTFIKSSIYLTLMNSILHSIFNLITSQFFGKHCQSMKNCSKTIWNTLSMSNKYGQENWILIVDILNLVGVVFTVFFFVYNRRRQYRLSAAIDVQTQNEADYTLLVSNIPILQFPKKGEEGRKLQFFHRKHLQQYFNGIICRWVGNKDSWERNKDKTGLQLLQLMNKNGGQLRSNEVVRTISLCYNLSRLQVLQNMKSHLISNFQDEEEGTSLIVNQQGQPIYSDRFASIPQRVNFLNDCQLILNGQYARDNSFLFTVTHFVGHAFISFQYEHYKQHLQQLFNSNTQSLNYNGNFLKIQDASHPTDIYWENIRIAQKQRRRRILSSYLVLAMVLVFSFIVLLFLQLWKETYSQSQSGEFINIAKSYSLTLVMALAIMTVNYGLDYLAHVLTQQQKRKTRTDFTFSILIKTFVTKLINTIMLYFFIALFFRSQSAQTQFLGPTGLIFQISTLIVVSGLLHILKSLIYPRELYQGLIRWCRYRKTQEKVQNKFQRTLNKQFQYPQFDLAQRYSYYLVNLYTAFFYSYLVPIGVPAICIIFFLQYWVDKLTLFRRSSLKYHFGFYLYNQTSKILQSSILALGLGNLIFSTYIHNNTLNLFNLIGCGIALAFTVLVWIAPKNLQRLVFGQYQYNEKYTYDDCLHDGKFQSTYWTQNPATFLIEQQKVTGRKKSGNPTLNRKSKQGGVFLSQFNS